MGKEFYGKGANVQVTAVSAAAAGICLLLRACAAEWTRVYMVCGSSGPVPTLPGWPTVAARSNTAQVKIPSLGIP
jgi:hypothetical protein